MRGRTVAIVSNEYREEHQRLIDDPIIAAMAVGLRDVPMDEMAHDGGTPRHEFMGAANAEYRSRGGEASFSIGGVANALLTLVCRERGL